MGDKKISNKKDLVEAGVDLLGDVVENIKKGVKKKKTKSKPGKQDDLFPETIPTTSEGQKAANKLSAAEKRKFKKAQTDMFPDALKDATEARKVKAVKNRKNAMKTKKKKDPEVENGITQKDLDRAERQLFPMKPKKKAAGGPIKKFAQGGPIKKFGKGKEVHWSKSTDKVKPKKVKIAEDVVGGVKDATKGIWAKVKKRKADKKKDASLLETTKEKPKGIRNKIEKVKDTIAGKKVAKARHAKLATSGQMTPRERKKVLKRQAQVGYAHGGPVRKSIDGIAQRGLTRAKHK